MVTLLPKVLYSSTAARHIFSNQEQESSFNNLKEFWTEPSVSIMVEILKVVVMIDFFPTYTAIIYYL